MTEQRRTSAGERDASMNGALADGAVLRSHELADLAGTTPRALRHYHQIGLLPEAPRDPNGYRRYGARDLVRVLRIRQLAASGMPLRKIGVALEQDARSQEALLAELDRELQHQAERIETQRRMLAGLRRISIRPERFSTAEGSTATQELDHDVWTLVTATGGVDTGTAAAMLDVLHSAPLEQRIADWYPEFERLETQSSVDAATADRMAERMADFADAVLGATGFAPATEELPIMALVEQMQAEALSPAQQEVWRRFLALVEVRWATG